MLTTLIARVLTDYAEYIVISNNTRSPFHFFLPFAFILLCEFDSCSNDLASIRYSGRLTEAPHRDSSLAHLHLFLVAQPKQMGDQQ